MAFLLNIMFCMAAFFTAFSAQNFLQGDFLHDVFCVTFCTAFFALHFPHGVLHNFFFFFFFAHSSVLSFFAWCFAQLFCCPILWTAFFCVVFRVTFPTGMARAPRPLSRPVHPPGPASGGGGQSLAPGESLLLAGAGAQESHSEQSAALGSLPGLRGRGTAPPAAPRRR